MTPTLSLFGSGNIASVVLAVRCEEPVGSYRRRGVVHGGGRDSGSASAPLP